MLPCSAANFSIA